MQVTPVSTPSSSKPTSEESPSTNIEAVDAIEVKKDCEESDADIRKVPEILAQASTSGTGTGTRNTRSHGSSRKRSTAPQEKETKRMKRLLRNRVSAQQARERKKAYVTDLETRMKEIEQRNAELEEKVSTLQRENFMLRQIVKNTTMKSNNAASGVPDLKA